MWGVHAARVSVCTTCLLTIRQTLGLPFYGAMTDPDLQWAKVSHRSQMARNTIKDYLKAKKVLQDDRLVSSTRRRGLLRMSQGAKGIRVSSGEERHNSERSLALHAGVSQMTLYRARNVLLYPDLDVAVRRGLVTLTTAAGTARERRRSGALTATPELPPVSQGPSHGIINTIMLADVLEGLRRMPDESVSLVVMSPPYPIAAVRYDRYEYDGDYGRYLGWMTEVLRECRRALRSGGRIAIQFDNCHSSDLQIRRGAAELLDLRTDLTLTMRRLRMSFRGEIIWHKRSRPGRPIMGSAVKQPRLHRTWEYICIYQKGKFGLRGSPLRVDVTDEERQAWSEAHWSIPPTRIGRRYHPAPFPVEIARRLIKLYTYVGDVVLDPFCGTGTTCCAAQECGRRWIGIDNSPLYVSHARKRLHVCCRRSQN